MWENSVQSVGEHSSVTTNVSNWDYTGFCQILQNLGNAYNLVHGYVGLTVCLFGTLANILNLVILTRKDMVNSTNVILAGLAFADLLTTVEYVPFVIYGNFLPDSENVDKTRKTWPWAVYVLFHSNFSQICHTIAIWLTVTAAVWRYYIVSKPLQCKYYCSVQRAKYTLILACVMSLVICSPIYLAFSIKTVNAPAPLNPPNVAAILRDLSANFTTEMKLTIQNPKYIVHLSDMAREHQWIVSLNFWMYSVVIKILPCICLSGVSYLLIRSLLKVKKRRQILLGLVPPSPPPVASSSPRSISTALAVEPLSIIGYTTSCPQLVSEASCSGQSKPVSTYAATSSAAGEMHYLTRRTTRMLLMVLFLFLITELPQGVLALFSDLRGDEFFTRCYLPMANLMDALALTNAALNFLLYFGTSVRFRRTFYTLANLCWSGSRR